MAKTGYVWDGTQFISISSPIAAVPNAIGSYSSITPTSPRTGQIWYDTATGFLKIYSGSVWNAVGVPYSATAPSSPTIGMLWIDSTIPALKVYDGSAWVSAGGSSADSDQNILANQVFR